MHDQDVVTARHRAAELGQMLGFDTSEQTRVATAVSEIARNAFRYATGGSRRVRRRRRTEPQLLVISVTDHGPGIPRLDDLLAGRYQSATGMGMGIVGARRLMDRFTLDTSTRGTTVILQKFLLAPARGGRPPNASARIAEALARKQPVRRWRRCSSRTRSCCARSTSCCASSRSSSHAEPRARGHQPRRRRALRRARREGRPPAARRRDEVALPLQHEPRVPHAAELDPRAAAPAADRADGAAHATSRRTQVGFIRKAAETSCRAGQRPARPRQDRGRQDRRAGRASSRSPTCSARCAACCGRCW